MNDEILKESTSAQNPSLSNEQGDAKLPDYFGFRVKTLEFQWLPFATSTHTRDPYIIKSTVPPKP